MNVMKANGCLLTAAFVWGFAFVAQRVGMDFLGPFTYNGVRYLLGSLSLLPLIWYFSRRPRETDVPQQSALFPGLVAGCFLFIGASLQQIGLVYTTAGKAAFITCLYIVIVPIFGIFLKHKVSRNTWLGCMMAAVGLYFLCVKEGFSIAYGDFLELAGTIFWACHILWIDHYSPRVNGFLLNCFQCMTCALFSLVAAFVVETPTWAGVTAATIPILYGSIGSVGIAYTLQIIGQRYAPPTHAAVIFSMETVFAAVGGYLVLGEVFGRAEAFGCVLMLGGVLLSQLGVGPGSAAVEPAEERA